MKTKNLFRFGFLMIAAMTLSFAGCKKSDSTSTNTKSDTESMQQLTKDENNVENATDQAANDANQVLTPAKLKSMQSNPCNTTVNVGSVVNDSITIDIFYHGLDCSNTHIRNGHVLVKKRFQEDWGQAGATVTITLQNFAITRVANNKTLTLNGTKYLQNVSGHYLWELGLDSTVTSIVERMTGSVTATFDNGSQRVWSIARQRTFTGSLINLVMTVDGFGSADGYTNLVTWGTNRNGELFYSSITQSVVYRQSCDWDPCSGIVVHEIPAVSKMATTTFGYDSNNNLITNGDCPTRYRIDWVFGSQSGTYFLPL